jgi:hypothetical protein
MKVRVLHHDHCFDGAASAAYFTRFAEKVFYPGAEFSYQGMMHAPSQTWDENLFDGDENAIVDFKYSPSPKVTWWFDHHQSAFLNSQDSEQFYRLKKAHHFYDPLYKSCTKFIAEVAKERFGFTAPDLEDLVHWADIIDGAQYASAKSAVELASPATQLVLVIEGSQEPGVIPSIIRAMQTTPLDSIMASPEIQSVFQPLYKNHLASIEVIRAASKEQGGVVFFDLSSQPMDGYNKFIPYYLFPDSVYTVSLLSTPFRTKISVGSNPWVAEVPKHNLASICERYGGGGHPRVGAISLEPGAIEKARVLAAEIVAELRD